MTSLTAPVLDACRAALAAAERDDPSTWLRALIDLDYLTGSPDASDDALRQARAILAHPAQGLADPVPPGFHPTTPARGGQKAGTHRHPDWTPGVAPVDRGGWG